MNDENLKSNTERTPSERKELARKAGIASGRARLRKKHGKELLRTLLAMEEKDPRILEEMARLGVSEKDATNEVVLHMRQLEKAKRKADTAAYNALLKAAGYTSDFEELNGSFQLNINVAGGSTPAVLKDIADGKAQR